MTEIEKQIICVFEHFLRGNSPSQAAETNYLFEMMKAKYPEEMYKVIDDVFRTTPD